MAKEQKTIYRVQFKEPPLNDDERTEFFFTSLAAIYDVFTAEQIGVIEQLQRWLVEVIAARVGRDDGGFGDGRGAQQAGLFHCEGSLCRTDVAF